MLVALLLRWPLGRADNFMLHTPRQIALLDEMKKLIQVFSARAPDRSTLDELHEMIGDGRAWRKANDLYLRIRHKTLAAEKSKDEIASSQYFFEEACAKTLHNMCGESAPFDADSPYWVVPNALSLARRMGIAESEITRIVGD